MDTTRTETVTAAAGDMAGMNRIWTHDGKMRNEQDRRGERTPVLLVFILELPRYLLSALIICSASVEVTVSLHLSRPPVGTRPF